MPIGEKTVLIVEDDEINLKLLEAILELLPCRTLTATNAEAGLPLARAYDPDLILMDLQLPGMDGIRATALLKADERLKQIPVIAMTGYGPSDFGQSLDRAGFSGLITKPFEVRSLLDTITEYLREFSIPTPKGIDL